VSVTLGRSEEVKHRLAAIIAALVLLAAGLSSFAVPALGHDWDGNCGAVGGVGLLYVFQDNPAGGDEENACTASDSNWGCCSGTTSIQNFNDKMSWYHLTDRDGDGQKFCVRFYEDAGFAGSQKLANGGDSLGGGGHKSLAAPAGWNDRVSSHEQYAVGGASC
jgi:hypothetical protein